jgi:hypothetical protein
MRRMVGDVAHEEQRVDVFDMRNRYYYPKAGDSRKKTPSVWLGPGDDT